ncbi:MAG: hypothetical protein ACHQQR_04965 [Gemmatimonadales bacterium]|jgi:hypothetical protein
MAKRKAKKRKAPQRKAPQRKPPQVVTLEQFDIGQVAVNLVYCDDLSFDCPWASYDFCPWNSRYFCGAREPTCFGAILQVPPLAVGDLPDIVGQISAMAPSQVRGVLTVVVSKAKAAAVRDVLTKK